MEKLSGQFTYDEIYMELWEMAQRYSAFVNFRVIGNSHDERMIPMIEIGKGEQVLFCISGMTGEERLCVQLLARMVNEYCNLYEKKWEMDNLYQVQELLDKVRICVIPMANPDGYEICCKGYRVIRNPVLRQMLRMQDIPYAEYEGNARNVTVKTDFPMHTMQKIGDGEMENLYLTGQYSVENETKALMNIFKEYKSVGMILWGMSGGKIIQYKFQPRITGITRDRRIALHLRKMMGYRLESDRGSDNSDSRRHDYKGNCGQYYAKTVRKPAFLIEIPQNKGENMSVNDKKDGQLLECYDTLKTIPLEFIFSI